MTSVRLSLLSFTCKGFSVGHSHTKLQFSTITIVSVSVSPLGYINPCFLSTRSSCLHVLAVPFLCFVTVFFVCFVNVSMNLRIKCFCYCISLLQPQFRPFLIFWESSEGSSKFQIRSLSHKCATVVWIA